MGDAFLAAPSIGGLKVNDTSELAINQYPSVPLRLVRVPCHSPLLCRAAEPSPNIASIKPWAFASKGECCDSCNHFFIFVYRF